ncbi:MAG: hypothetical protein C0390_02665 [Syntrophus sp. (in: bacteria)]|nr:hypothetical protein [Syntrophus sp. (in: bacteria)]
MRLLKTYKKTSAKRGFRHGILLLLLIMALGSLLTGCAGRRVPLSESEYFSPEAALKALASSDPGGRTITVTARMEINSRGERHLLKAALMIRRPAHLRLESIPLFGPPDFFLSIDAGEIRVFLPGKEAFYADRATEGNLSRFFPLALPASEIVSLLMGRLPETEETVSSWRGEWEDGMYRVDQYRDGREIRSVWIDPAGNLLRRIRTFTKGGSIAYSADFAEHARTGEGFLPQRLTIAKEGMSLAVRYTDVRLDNDGESFALPVPEGITPLPLD